MKIRLAKLFFIFLCIFQILIISLMIYNANRILKGDKIVKLKCVLYDPYDIMKGRYIQLRFDLNSINFTNLPSGNLIDTENLDKYNNEKIYCVFQKDNGLSIIEDISFEIPDKQKLFLKSEIDYVTVDNIILKPSFDRYYMQEDLAKKAEELLTAENLKELNPVLILAVDDEGRAIQKGMKVNGIDIEKYIKEN